MWRLKTIVIITFVYDIILYCPLNKQVHSAFCPQNAFCGRKYVLASIFCGHNANSLVFFVGKRLYGVSWFPNEFIQVPNCGIIPKERALGDENVFPWKDPCGCEKPSRVLWAGERSSIRARSAIAEIWWLSRLLFRDLMTVKALV